MFLLRHIALILVFIPLTTIYASGVLDSLKSLAQHQEGIERARMLIRLSNEYIKYSNFAEAAESAGEALDIYTTAGDKYGIADAYNAFASNFIIRRNVDSISNYAQKALSISDSLDYEAGRAYALNNLGLGSVYAGDTDKADSLVMLANSMFKSQNIKPGYASSLMNLGISGMYSGKTKEAVEYYENASVVFLEIGDSVSYANAMLNIGSLCANILGEYDKAIAATLKAQRIYEQINNRARLAYCKMILGSVYEFTNRIRDAIANYKLAIAIHREKENLHMEGVTLNYIGEAFTKESQYDSAIVYYNKSLKINEEIDHKEGISIARFNIANAYYNLGNYKEALTYFSRAHEYLLQTRDKFKITESFNKLGDVQFKLGNVRSAIDNYLQAVRYAKEANAREELKNSYEDLAEVYESTGNFRNANKYLRLYSEVKDSLLNERTAKDIAELEQKYEAEKKLKEIELLKRDTELNEMANQRQLIIIVFLIVFSVFLLYASFKYFKKYKENIRINKELEKTVKTLDQKSNELLESNKKLQDANKLLVESEADLKKLNATKDKFFSIIAHDMRSPINTLNSYIMYLLENGPELNDDEMNELLSDLTKHFNRVEKMLENLLNWSVTQFEHYKLNQEDFDLNEIILKNSGLYESTIKQKKISVRFRLSARSLVRADKNMIDVVVRNLITNAIRYNKENGRIEYETLNESGKIICVIRDSGIGMDESQLDSLFDIGKSAHIRDSTRGGTGLGLVICKEFIDKNNGEIKASSTAGKGTEITFTLPAKY